MWSFILFCVKRREFGIVEELISKFDRVEVEGLENLVGVLWGVAIFKYQINRF